MPGGYSWGHGTQLRKADVDFSCGNLLNRATRAFAIEHLDIEAGIAEPALLLCEKQTDVHAMR